jgi:hypothetical protein
MDVGFRSPFPDFFKRREVAKAVLLPAARGARKRITSPDKK